MRLETESHGSTLVVRLLESRIDAASAVQFKDAMRQTVDQAPDRVVLDMTAVDAIDSSGLGAIVSVMKFLGGERSFELAGLSEKVITVFRLTRMDTIITIHDSVETALGTVARAS
ncbi:MAG: STAS domain-containing protein [Pseudomonadota bacterium]